MKVKLLLLLLLVACTWITYSNHFNSSFHFDDEHTIVNNVYIKDLKNIPLFFKDGTTFSALPANQSYRPVVSASLAVDYKLGNGLVPFYFHIITFLLFLLQTILLFFFCLKIFNVAQPGDWNLYLAFVAAAWYGLHPANAETVNYIIARADIQSTLFTVLAFTLYVYSPFCKKYGLYLLPLVAGILAKPPAAMFAPMLFTYVVLFEEKIGLADLFRKKYISHTIRAVKKVFPAFIICTACYLFVSKMTPDTWVPGGSSPLLYLITQPFVILHYFYTWFLPTQLSADSDWTLLTSISDFRFITGIIFIAALLFTALYTSAKEKLRPISFGITWFLLALVPTSSIIPLSEVMNDHRMYFAFIGMAIGITWALGLWLKRYCPAFTAIPGKLKLVLSSVVVAVLFLYAWGTFQRNKVWANDESLWQDVTEKSPLNGRGWMNYGLTQMKKGNYSEAEKCFMKALQITPGYSLLHINLAIVKNATGDAVTAENDFKKALELNPGDYNSYYYYAKFLNTCKRNGEAIALLQKAIKLAPSFMDTRLELMESYAQTGQWEVLTTLANESSQLDSSNSMIAIYKQKAAMQLQGPDVVAADIRNNPSPEKYLELSLLYYNAARYNDCIKAAEEAIKLRADYAAAYNNIGTAYNMLHRYDNAIAACKKALTLQPGYTLAANNLAVAEKAKLQSQSQSQAQYAPDTPEYYIEQSLAFYNKGLYRECINAAAKALKLRPSYALAYNNQCAAYNQLKKWDEAIAAGEAGLKNDPANVLLKGNLAASYKGKKEAGGK